MKSANVSLFAFPLHLSSPNAYWDGLAKALIKIESSLILINASWLQLLFGWHRSQIIHIHWPLVMYASRHIWLQPLKLFFSLGILRLAKLRGDRIVWTMHNTHDHDQIGSNLDARAAIYSFNGILTS